MYSGGPRVRTELNAPLGVLFIYYYFPGDPEAVQEQALQPQKNCLHRECCHVAYPLVIKYRVNNSFDGEYLEKPEIFT